MYYKAIHSKLLTTFIALAVLIGIAGVGLGVATWWLNQKPKNEIASIPEAVLKDKYSSEIQPIFTARCIACHSCFNSPCQLDLTSYDGVARGASHVDPYDFPLKESRPPTRMGIDAKNEKEWRTKGFFSVLHPEDKGPSILVELARPSNPARQEHYDSENSRVCIDRGDADHLKSFFAANPGGRMPFGLPPLHQTQFDKISEWVKSGAHGPSKEAELALISTSARDGEEIVKRWEDYFNRTDFKSRLTARYIYEHLFAAHLQIEGLPGELYRLVRADAPTGRFNELPSTRPYDDLARPFHYRLKRYSSAVVAKTNLLYRLDKKRRGRWKQLFEDTKWEPGPDKFPAYGANGANAFETFKRIPVDSRYRFMLDDAYYHVAAFIKGPVCRGQTALNVINDHFWVMFIDPRFDRMAKDSKLASEMAPLMAPPATEEDEITLFKNFREGYWKASQLKYDAYKKVGRTFGAESIWDGDQTNRSALLTVYRHFDSAQVMYGAWGEIPDTVWVMDYQIFEDIYYNLVAGYNVFGPMIHQINTRLYMDLSRISSEDMFLNFLPAKERGPLRESWYKDVPEKKESIAKTIVDLLGQDVETLSKRKYPYLGTEIKSALEKGDEATFLTQVFTQRFSEDVRGSQDIINRRKSESLPWATHLTGEATEIKALRKIAGLKEPFVQHFPDTALLRVRGTWSDRVYTLVRNKAHLNVAMILFEDERRDPKRDTLNVVPGYATAYPNLYLDVDSGSLDEFVDSLAKVNTKAEWLDWVRRFGIDRQSDRFWEVNDWFNQEGIEHNPNDPGHLDLNRYVDPFNQLKEDKT